jgi:hypothetical protein
MRPKEVEWSYKTMVDYILECRLEAKGLPMFRTKRGKEHFPEGVVLGVCYGGNNDIKHDFSIHFLHTNPAVIDKLDREREDWIWIMTETDEGKKHMNKVLEKRDGKYHPTTELVLQGGKLPMFGGTR